VQDPTGNRVALPAPLYFSIDSLLSLKNVFNYPNPFASETHFTFILTDYADEVKIKIYTITGRLIQDIQVPPQSSAYYRVYWNGRDHDGDTIANGIYFYKVIAKSNGSATEVIQKLARVR
jgi:flagellar hook assembly protein FlgD